MTNMMTAAERREAFYENNYGFRHEDDDHYWDFAMPLSDMTEMALERVERLFGAEASATPLRQLLEPVAAIPGMHGGTWREVLEAQILGFADALPISRRLNDALLYGLYGIVPEEIPVPERAGWLGNLVEDVSAFAERSDNRSTGGQDTVFRKIADLAASRQAIDTGQGEVDVHSMAVLGGITEGRVRNLLSGTDSALERGPTGGIVAMSAQAWLQKKKGFLASIWQEEESDESDVDPEAGPALSADRMIFVPVARDGSMFTPDLTRNGAYRIGAKGEEEDISSFSEALARLNAMPVPRWRRPNEKGLWGIVSGVAWQRIEKK